jgi:hypothetical protein
VQGGRAEEDELVVALARFVAAAGPIAPTLRWILLIDEADMSDAVRASLPPGTRLAYTDRAVPNSDGIALGVLQRDMLLTEYVLYVCLDQAEPGIFHGLGYAGAVLDAHPQLGGARFEASAPMLKILQPLTGKALVDAYNSWARRTPRFFHNLLMRLAALGGHSHWTREGLRYILTHLQVAEFPIKSAGESGAHEAADRGRRYSDAQS